MPPNRRTVLRKSPVQARGKATRDAVLSAAADILASDGQSALNTNRVAELAGVSVGALYQYFPNKLSICVALVQNHYTQVLADMGAELPELDGETPPGAEIDKRASLLTQIQSLARASQSQLVRDPRRVPALERVAEELGHLPDLAALRTRITAQLVDLLAMHYVERPETVAEDILALTRALAIASITRGDRPGPALEQRMDRTIAGYFAGVSTS